MIKILFICHGNICRSPMAEYVMRALVEREGCAGRFVIASAAVSREELGQPAYPPVRRLLSGRGIDCSGHRARQMTAADYEAWDYLIGMDGSNLQRMRRICGGDPDGKLSLLLDWTGAGGDVADPWYTGDFEQTWRDVSAGCRAILDRLCPPDDAPDAAALVRLLGAAGDGLCIETAGTVTSTNQLLRERAEAGAPAGLVLAAAAQTAGRGRRGRSFFSPGGSGLYLSVLLRPTLPAADTPLLTAAAAVAAAEAVEAVSGRAAQIKWVNDVLLDGKKVCGILTEGKLSPRDGQMEYVVVGAGFNLSPPEGGFPPELAETAGTILPAAQAGARCRLAAEFLRRLLPYCETVGAGAYLDDYRARCMLFGRTVTVHAAGGASRTATALAVDDRCRLLVEYNDGTRAALDSGEVSLHPEQPA